MSTYKVGVERMQKILLAASPRVIFVNSPPGLNVETFVKPLKKEYSVISLEKFSESTIQNRLRDSENFLLIYGWVENAENIEKLFQKCPDFTYVYLYPAESRAYVDRISSFLVSEIPGGILLDASETMTRESAKKVLKKVSNVYKLHLEYFRHILIGLVDF